MDRALYRRTPEATAGHMCGTNRELACYMSAFSAKSAVSANCANNFWPNKAMLKNCGFWRVHEFMEITVSTFQMEVISGVYERQVLER